MSLNLPTPVSSLGRGGSRLNRSIADAAPGQVRRQLGCKTALYGS